MTKGSRTLFEERSSGVLAALTAGVSIADAAGEAAVNVGTVKAWLRRGRADPSSKYGPFAREVAARRAERELPEDLPLDERELRRVVSRAARKGNVQAQRLAWEMLRAASEGDPPGESDPLAPLDRLAEGS